LWENVSLSFPRTYIIQLSPSLFTQRPCICLNLRARDGIASLQRPPRVSLASRPGNHLQSLTPFPIFSSLNAIYLAMGGRHNNTKLRSRKESPCRARTRFCRRSICLSNPMDVGETL